jgi:hypothetical protein
MMTGLHGEQLDAWIEQVRADDLPPLHSFAADCNASTQQWSTG